MAPEPHLLVSGHPQERSAADRAAAAGPAGERKTMPGPRRRRTGPDGTGGWTSPQMLTRYGASTRGARARRSYDRIMNDTT